MSKNDYCTTKAKAVGIYSYTFKSVILESVKIKISPKVSKRSQKSFLKISENNTFESVILKSVKIESVGVDAHGLNIITFLPQRRGLDPARLRDYETKSSDHERKHK